MSEKSSEVAMRDSNALWQGLSNWDAGTKPLIPNVDIYENQNEIILLADMPGVKKDGLNVQLENEVLTIEGEITLKVPDKANPIHTEINSRNYARSFTLSKELDTSRIDANMEAGVLTLRIPKSEATKPKKITVSSS